MRTVESISFSTLVSLLWATLLWTSPAGAITYGCEYMTTWSGCTCSQNSLSYTDNQANYFDSKMSSLGHTRKFKYGNQGAWAADVTEDRDFGGYDRWYGDTVDMYMYSGHGGAGTDAYGNQTFLVPYCSFNGSGSCYFYADNARLGEKVGWYASPYPGNLRYSMWCTCHSVDTDPMHQWDQTMNTGMDYVMGYRGTSADSWTTDEVPEDWASKAMRSSNPDTFKGAWFWAIEDWWVDDVGSVIANGDNESDAIYRRDHYKRTWYGPHTDYHYWYAWAWHEG